MTSERMKRETLARRAPRRLGTRALAAAPPPLHRLLADVPVPLLIVTTNLDAQLERAFAAAGRPYDLVVYPADRRDLGNAVLWWPHGATEPTTPATNELDIDLATTTVLFKMHGAFLPDTDAWDGCVVTEEDYVEFLSRVRALLLRRPLRTGDSVGTTLTPPPVLNERPVAIDSHECIERLVALDPVQQMGRQRLTRQFARFQRTR